MPVPVKLRAIHSNCGEVGSTVFTKLFKPFLVLRKRKHRLDNDRALRAKELAKAKELDRKRGEEARLRQSLGINATSAPLSLSITSYGATNLADRLVTALADSCSNRVELPDVVRNIEGMSGQIYRSLINRLVALDGSTRYLEIGSWKGSTAVSAMYNNSGTALCIDNWSFFGGPKGEFVRNVAVLEQNRNLNFEYKESDFREIDYSGIGKYNVYLFDGPHEDKDHYDGVVIVQPALDDEYLLIVDDWNWLDVRVGTLRALADVAGRILCVMEVRTTFDGSYPEQEGKESDWHNGYFFAVVRKNKTDSVVLEIG